MVEQNNAAPCPCQSGQPYEKCCAQYHKKLAPPKTPEALMRSRFSAYALGIEQYLLETWAPKTRPTTITLPTDVKWCGLQILSATRTAEENQQAKVHFKALYRQHDVTRFLEEISAFERQAGRWFYVDGKVSEGVHKIKRNDPCPCDSGKKYKVCCGRS